MSDQSTTTPRALTAIIADREVAEKAIADLGEKASKADRESAEANLATIVAEEKEAKRTLLQAAYDAKQAEYRSATTAGVKAALRRDMNKLREKLGLPALVAGTKSSGPRFDDAVLAILESDEDLSL